MNVIKRVRLFVYGSLIFSFLVNGCREHHQSNSGISLEWEGAQVQKVLVSRSLLGDTPHDSIQSRLHFHLAKPDAPPILGDYLVTDDYVAFRPLIAFTQGLRYEVRLTNKTIGEITIPARVSKAPVVTHVYPGTGPVPENLLKMYVRFSQPMQEGFSAQDIQFIRDTDTLNNVFLNLNQELWSPDRTMLTLWLDPGRIKRDLQPNQRLGPPLTAGTVFQLRISGWPDAHGVKMDTALVSSFEVSARDTISPDPDKWFVGEPKAGTRQPVSLDLHESLDYMLLQEAMRVVDDKGNSVPGTIQTGYLEKSWSFYPENNWLPGTYTIEIESRLEDLAGNNLNRLFDNDLTKPQKKNPQDVYKKTFRVR